VPYVLESMDCQWYCQGFVSVFQRPLKRFTDVGKVLKKEEETKKENATRVIAEISNVIRNCMSQNYTGGRQISHYLDIHRNLPLWVLAKQLTFGNISYFYSSIEESLQKEICEEIAIEYKKE